MCQHRDPGPNREGTSAVEDSARLEARREAARERARRWREANRERALEGQRRWYQANREKANDKSRLYYQEHREEQLEAGRRRREDNKEERRERQRQYREGIRQKVLAYYSPSSPPCCACCGTREDLTIDHINGGGNEHRKEIGVAFFPAWLVKENFPPGYQVLCRKCNTSKGDSENCHLHAWRYFIHRRCTR